MRRITGGRRRDADADTDRLRGSIQRAKFAMLSVTFLARSCSTAMESKVSSTAPRTLSYQSSLVEPISRFQFCNHSLFRSVPSLFAPYHASSKSSTCAPHRSTPSRSSSRSRSSSHGSSSSNTRDLNERCLSARFRARPLRGESLTHALNSSNVMPPESFSSSRSNICANTLCGPWKPNLPIAAMNSSRSTRLSQSSSKCSKSCTNPILCS